MQIRLKNISNKEVPYIKKSSGAIDRIRILKSDEVIYGCCININTYLGGVFLKANNGTKFEFDLIEYCNHLEMRVDK